MKHLFEMDLRTGEVDFAPQILFIKEFKNLWDFHKKDKEMACRELAAVYFYADVRSSYKNNEEAIRWEEIKKDVLYDLPNWKPSKVVLECVKKYEELSRPITADSLEAAKEGQKKLNRFITELDLNETDDNGKPLHDPKKIQMIINDMPKMVKSILEIQRAVESELEESNSLRAGREKSPFEDDEMNPG